MFSLRAIAFALLCAVAAGCILPDTAQQHRLDARQLGVAAPDIEALLGQMTLEEKIGQMTQADRGALEHESDIASYALGSILSGGNSLVVPNQARVWADTTDRYQAQALRSRLGIPLLYGIDAVHGMGTVRGTVIFPHNIGLGAAGDPELVRAAARVTALEMSGAGISWTFAPCLAVPRDERWGRTYEGFGETPELVRTLGAAAVVGFQTDKLGAPGSVLACAKHFLGDGGTLGGVDCGDTRLSEAELRAIHLPGYVAAIEAGVGSIMVSYSSVNGAPMHGHRRLITDVLKGELGFQGFVVTDWQGLDRISGDYPSDVATAINAGIDMVMVPIRYKRFIATLTGLVREGRVPLARIDDAVRRILRQKAALGLWRYPFADRTRTAAIGSAEHRAVARRAVRASLVLLKNERAAFPIAKHARVHVGGSKADDLGVQCGGWSAGWQGGRGPITEGTTILQALRQALPAPGQVSFASDGSGGDDAEVAIAVVGELPYAEGKGDTQDLALPPEDLALVANMHRSARRLIVILITGRPLVLGNALSDADALLVAWLPGTEGEGIADVLLGEYEPTGKLPHSWPRSLTDVPLNVGDPGYAPLFPYGFGLGRARRRDEREAFLGKLMPLAEVR